MTRRFVVPEKLAGDDAGIFRLSQFAAIENVNKREEESENVMLKKPKKEEEVALLLHSVPSTARPNRP